MCIGRFDAYQPKFGVGDTRDTQEPQRMPSVREKWEQKEKERTSRSVKKTLSLANKDDDKHVNSPSPSQHAKAPSLNKSSSSSSSHDNHSIGSHAGVEHLTVTPGHVKGKSKMCSHDAYCKRSIFYVVAQCITLKLALGTTFI